MKLSIFVVLLLCMPLALAIAQDAEFIAVVGANAPPSDVITAANFAANMKLEADATFSGALDDELRDLSEEDLAKMTVVVIDGEYVEVIVGSETPHTHNIVAQRSLSYFKTLGFDATLKMRESVNPEFISIQNEREDEPAQIEVEPEVVEPTCEACENNDECYVMGDIVELQYCDGSDFVALKGNGDTCVEDYECLTSCVDGVCGQEMPEPLDEEVVQANDPIEEEKPNFVIRFVSWITGWFS